MRDNGEITAVAAGLGRAAVIAWGTDLASPGATRRDHGALLPDRTPVTPIPLMRRPGRLVAQTARRRVVPDRPRRPRLTRLAAMEALR